VAAVTACTSLPSDRRNVVRRLYKGSMGHCEDGGPQYMVSLAPRSLS